MADGKKSFVLYCDLLSTVEKLSDDDAGKLMKHLLRYVNDHDPEPPSTLIDLVFEPIRLQLKRDLVKWVGVGEKRKISGSKGGIKSGESRRKKQTKQVLKNRSKSKQNEANEAVTVNDTVTVTVNEKEKRKKIEFIPPQLPDVIQYFKDHGYSELVARKAFEFYNSANWFDSKGKEIKNWKQKMIGVWFKDEHKVEVLKAETQEERRHRLMLQDKGLIK